MDEAAVNAIATNMAKGLPVFVSVLPATVCGIVVATILLLIGLRMAYKEHKHTEGASSLEERLRWFVILVVTCIIASNAMIWTQRFVYQCMSIGQNKQHYANCVWLNKYIMAMKT
jgi:hypothetical protein